LPKERICGNLRSEAVMTYFPLAEYWWLYATFLLFILMILFFDLGFFRKKSAKVTAKESLLWTLFWIVTAFIFNIGLYYYTQSVTGSAEVARQISLEFLTGFVVEKVLAIDNIFVFSLVFTSFAIPEKHQHRILFWGILGAIFFRAIFISIGSILMQYHWVVVSFGILLAITGIKLFFTADKPSNIHNSLIVKTLRRFMPISTNPNTDQFTIIENGKRYATPLLAALIFIEVSDIIFAVDSVPAIFALTDEALIVFTSNIFAMMGLRSLFFVFADIIKRFEYIKYGMAVILVFIGIKMSWLNTIFNGKFPIQWSLLIIGTILLITISISTIKSKYNELKLSLKRNLLLKDTNEALARGAAIGFFFGVSILWGLQIAASVTLSHLLKGNKVISAWFTFISNPLTTLPLYTLCYFIGHLLIGGTDEAIGINNLSDWRSFLSQGNTFIMTMILGTTIIGLVGAVGTYSAIKLFKRKTP